ncbi:colicin N immunity protein [Klebsiella pneumoniae]|jgi:hypothetical protein|uniref:colicin N immunity protein n=1 Tax=Klebsiella pneumoniae TaxID=573 RepID=UPI000D5751E9|nr:colicin N immunity protein [Klebsiella pneumoniae]PVW18341.1 colicin N immunity protein [Klebsiella pneumoniae]
MDIKDRNKISKKISSSLLLLLSPFALIFFSYNNAPIPLLEKIIAYLSLPGFHSLNNPPLSEAFNLYVHTAPLAAISLFIFTHKELELKPKSSPLRALKILTPFTILYISMIYCFLLTDTELTLSSKTFVLMSKNDLFLSFFYITLYIGIYIFTYLYFWFLIGTYKLFTRGGILP